MRRVCVTPKLSIIGSWTFRTRGLTLFATSVTGRLSDVCVDYRFHGGVTVPPGETCTGEVAPGSSPKKPPACGRRTTAPISI